MNLLLIFGFSEIKRSESEEDEHENLNMLLLFDFMFVGRWNGMEWNGSRKGRFCGLKFLCPVLKLKSSASMVLLPRLSSLNSLRPRSGPK